MEQFINSLQALRHLGLAGSMLLAFAIWQVFRGWRNREICRSELLAFMAAVALVFLPVVYLLVSKTQYHGALVHRMSALFVAGVFLTIVVVFCRVCFRSLLSKMLFALLVSAMAVESFWLRPLQQPDFVLKQSCHGVEKIEPCRPLVAVCDQILQYLANDPRFGAGSPRKKITVINSEFFLFSPVSCSLRARDQGVSVVFNDITNMIRVNLNTGHDSTLTYLARHELLTGHMLVNRGGLCVMERDTFCDLADKQMYIALKNSPIFRVVHSTGDLFLLERKAVRAVPGSSHDKKLEITMDLRHPYQ